MISKKDIEQIVNQATPIHERLNCQLCSANGNQCDDSEALLDFWCQTVAKGNKNIFEKRLSWDELSINDVIAALNTNTIYTSASFPEWGDIFYEIIEEFYTLKSLPFNYDDNKIFEQNSPLAFESFFLPFIHVARRKLFNESMGRHYLVTDKCLTILERQLLIRLTSLCSQAIYLEFSNYKSSILGTLRNQIDNIDNTHKKENYIYSKFIEHLSKESFLTFFKKYSVLARLTSIATNFWIDSNAELLERLESDWRDIHSTFDLKDFDKSNQIIDVKSFLSDPHHNGRYVSVITFKSGIKIVYKPKNLGIDKAYYNLLNWINEQNELPKLKSLKIISRKDYGWVEYVQQIPCVSQSEANMYYMRAGMLLCLLYSLKATDCHFENLVACGEFPVIVDIENFASHRLRRVVNSEHKRSGQDIAAEQLWNSVLRTGLLPQWEFGFLDQGHEVSGLGGVIRQKTFSKVQIWKNINTDNMSLTYDFAEAELRSNVVFFHETTLQPIDFVEEIINGFKLMYNFMLHRRDLLISDNSPLNSFKHQKVRFIFRPTRVYWSILNQSLSPKFLKDGRSRSILLETLSRGLVLSNHKPTSWPITKLEYESLERLDIPYFYSFSSTDYLFLSESIKIAKYFQEPSYQSIITTIESLDYDDLARQIELIKGALYSQFGSFSSILSKLSECTKLELLALPNLTEEVEKTFKQEALKIAEGLSRRAISGEDGSKAWIGLEYSPKLEKFKLRPVGFSLYDGCCGIALLFGALYKITQDKIFSSLTLSALQTLRNSLYKEEFNRFSIEAGIGGAIGLGSIIYSLVRCSDFLSDLNLLEDAERIASFIEPEIIDSDNHLDILSGSAGAVLSLLSLYKKTGKDKFLEKAIFCGKRLVKCFTTTTAGYRAWITLGGRFLTGFSHGTSGITYALLKLYEITKEDIFLAIAFEGIKYESLLFSRDKGNWADLRIESSSSRYLKRSWCHGSPGIILSRLGNFKFFRDQEVTEEIEIALNYLKRLGLQTNDTLCCGNFGKIEALLVAAIILERPDLLETSRQWSKILIQRAKESGSFCLFANLPRSIYNPGFFQGVAGIGYELLRLSYPNLLPSVLLWE
jgi:type 2 lantibiotic biosynthesis protein LanM